MSNDQIQKLKLEFEKALKESKGTWRTPIIGPVSLEDERVRKAINFGLNFGGTVSGRFSSSGPNLQELSREDAYEKLANYAELEARVFTAVYPGKDGIGADIIPDFLQGEERKVGMSPVLGMPYGENPCLSLDILKTEDVIYAGHHRAKVLQFDSNKDSVEIKFNDAGLIPPTMWVPVRDLSYAYGGRIINPQTHCPNCDIKWKEVVLARFSVWDCPSCGAKKEDHAR